MTAPPDFVIPSLRSLYGSDYDERMLAWRRVGAADKVANLRSTLQQARVPLPLHDVLEVGCGTGDVLRGVVAAGIAPRGAGIEIDEARAGHELIAIPETGVAVHAYDGRHIPYPDQSFDLVYATHVLEHVLDMRGFLHELRRVARHHVYVEVPCELHLLTTRRKMQSSLDIGHINAFTLDSFQLTLETSGLRVTSIRVADHDMAVHRFHGSPAKATIKALVRRSLLALSPALATRMACYHVGALCAPSDTLDLG